MFVVDSVPLITALRLIIPTQLLLLENRRKSIIIQYILLYRYISNIKGKRDLQIFSV